MPTSRTRTAGRDRRQPPGAHADATRMFAFAIPGLASQVADELASIPGVQVQEPGFDGRSDVVLFTADAAALRNVLAVRVAEDVFVEVGRTLRSEGDRAPWIANGCGDRSGRVGHWPPVPGWCARVSDVRMRQHDGRRAERRGALRPTAAAAMVRLAGAPAGILLDPCCDSGTILIEALRAGWQARGTDIDSDAVRVARTNADGATVRLGDARQLRFEDASVAACVSNLPFGQQYDVDGGMDEWLRAVLGELCRVTRPGGRVVLLAPRIPRSVTPDRLARTDRLPIGLLGARTTVWASHRR